MSATNPQNLRTGSRVKVIDPSLGAEYKRGHVGRVIEVVPCRADSGDPPSTIVIVRCEDCALGDGSPNHHYMDATDVERTHR